MAVTLKVKKSPKTMTEMTVDRVIELKHKLDAVAAEQKEYDKLVKELRTEAMEVDPDQVVSFEGTKGTVVFGEASRQRVLADMAGVKKALGNELFMSIAKVTLGDLDKYLSTEESAPLVEQGRGPRKIDIVEK